MHDPRIRQQPPTALLILAVLLAVVPGAASTDAQTRTEAMITSPSAASQPDPTGALQASGAEPAWLRVRGEFRERMESAGGIGFAPDRNDTFWLSRLRISAWITASPWLRFHAQAQDARVAAKDIGPTGLPFSAPLDVRIAQVELGRTSSPVTTTLGRQELVFGEQRLVGHVSWVNAARTFDAARATIRQPGLQLDLFAGSVVTIRTDDWDRGGLGNRFHGAYLSTTRWLPRTTVEPYFLWRSDRDRRTEAGAAGDLQLVTGGVRLAGRIAGDVDFGSETVVQRGSLGTDSHRAFAQHLRLRSPALAHDTRVSSEYNYASGDRTPSDGRRGTFDPLYPTAHNKYGLADQVGWRNIHHVRLALELATIPRTPLAVAYHSWWLASRTDALYVAGGAPLARIADGAPSRHVGHGFDISGSHAITPRLDAAAGYAHIRPGGFLKAATPGQSYNSVYLMATYAVTMERSHDAR